MTVRSIKWSHRARRDLRDIKEHIAKDSPFYAQHFVGRIIDSTEVLFDHPKIGRPVPEAEREDVRELIYQSYRILYLLKTDIINIITIFHGSRDLGGMQPKPWDIG